jgi:hypothetical protein
MSNYRPVSLLTTFSKVIEKVMHNRLSHYIQTNIIPLPEQCGLRKGIYTENAAIKLIDSVSKSADQKMYVSRIFYDLNKIAIYNAYFLNSISTLTPPPFPDLTTSLSSD